jgi:hypothetical protein
MDQPVSAARHILMLVLASASLAVSGEGLRDPMMPPQAPGRSGAPAIATAPSLTAIVEGETGRVAILNGVAVRTGDRVGDIQILAVLADRVRLRRGDRVQELHLPAKGPSFLMTAAPVPGPSRGVDP